MVRILLPELKVMKDGRGGVVPVCYNEGGYVKSPWYTPILALSLFLFWWAFLTLMLLRIGVIPPEADPFSLMNAFFERSA